jgi:hypothetical protein
VDLFTAVVNAPGGPLPTKLVTGGTITSGTYFPHGIAFSHFRQEGDF